MKRAYTRIHNKLLKQLNRPGVVGLLFGLAGSGITVALGSGYTHIITFALVIVALALRPNGLFGRAEVKKV